MEKKVATHRLSRKEFLKEAADQKEGRDRKW